ncbi:vomeronasal type-2 receptor 26-like [Pleurodeles waltl]|uniref:vomeronasal type-2 receptor 26-like n=1 Tax=Pleurodeles waltl TaxID=8319 RepID=UPI003709B278
MVKIAAAKAKINRWYSEVVASKFLRHKAACYEYDIAEVTKSPLGLVLLNAEKAFNCVPWDYIWEISYGAALGALSDKVQFPSFLRTIANAGSRAHAFIELCLHFGWNWIGILASDNDYGLENGQKLMEEAPKNGICQHPSEEGDLNSNRPDGADPEGSEQAELPLSKEVGGPEMLGPEDHRGVCVFTLIADHLLRLAIYDFGGSAGVTQYKLLHYLKNVHTKNSASKEVSFDRNGDAPPLLDFVHWQMTSKDTSRFLKVGTFDSSAPRGQKLIINNSAIQWSGSSHKVPISICSEPCLPGYRKSAIEGKPRCCFECVPCSEGSITNLTDSADCMKCPDDHWSSVLGDRCIPKSIVFLSYKEPLGSTLAFMSVFFFCNTLYVLGVFIWYRDTPVVKANNRGISYLLLVSLMLCFLSAMNFIGHPKKETCMLRQIVFGIIFSTCVSCVLAKTITVVMVFRATKPDSNLKKFLGKKIAYTIVLTCTVIQMTIGIAWLTTSPSFPEHITSPATREIILGCNEGSIVWFYSMLAFMGLLASVSFLISFLARNLPDSFNETKFITFSMLVFVSVWLSFIPAYLSTKGKYLVAVETFAILSSSAGLLFCIFTPKIFIIFWRPDRNTREYLISNSKLAMKTK